MIRIRPQHGEVDNAVTVEVPKHQAPDVGAYHLRSLEGAVAISVSRRPKPATHEHLKTSHFEETRIGRVGSSADSAEGDPTWRINSRWHSSRPFSPCIGGAGRSGALPGN